MPVPAYVEPNTNLTKMERYAKATFLYIFDLQLFLWIVPRGVKLTLRLASMVFLKLGLVSSTAYINFALVSTIRADRGLIPPSTLTMSTGRILGLPAKNCHREKRSTGSGWNELLERMTMEQDTTIRTPAEKIISLDEEELIETVFGSNTSATKGAEEEYSNVTTPILDDFTDVIPDGNNSVLNDSMDVVPTGHPDQNLVDTAVQVLLEYFDLQLTAADIDSTDYDYDDEMEMGAEFLSNKLAQEVSSKTLTKGKAPKRKGRSCKLLSRTDLKIILAALASICFLTAGILSCLICRSCSKRQVASMDLEVQGPREEVTSV